MQVHQFVVVVDFGTRQAESIARRVRSYQVYSEVWPNTASADQYKERIPSGVILLTGDQPELQDAARQLLARLDQSEVPVLALGPKELAQDVSDAMKSYLVDTCHIEPNWTPQRFIEQQIEQIRTTVGEQGEVVCALSGGVDSSVAAALVHRAVGDRLHSIFVDHGLMRMGEPEQVAATFGERFGSNFVHVDAADRFLSKLAGVTDPEKKRRIIGEEFIRVFEEEAGKIGNVRYLVQGTVYPDVIESGIGGALVKSHHNVGGLPEHMNLELIEPLRYLFKDEVRKVGEALGLPKELVWRQPFPGPGLAVRILGEITRERVDIERRCDAIVREELTKAGLMESIWQAFAVLTEARTVGVQGDARTYGYVAAVRAVASEDAMVAEWSRIPYDVLDAISRRILSEVPAVGRVVYDISPKPPSTIEWE